MSLFLWNSNAKAGKVEEFPCGSPSYSGPGLQAQMLVENTEDPYTNGHFRHAGRRVFAGVDRHFCE